ncbi:MAG: transcription elongation factor Spt5 [Caldivirga sp.]|jgi:transcriptional antiterminator NusG
MQEECSFIGIRVVSGQEYNVAAIIRTRLELMDKEKKKYYKVASIVVPPNIQGQVYLETQHSYVAVDLSAGIKQYRGLMMGKAPLSELMKMIKREVKVQVNDVVEIITEPFRGFKARVIDVDERNNTVKLLLFDTATNIPVTLPIKSVRVIEGRKQ